MLKAKKKEKKVLPVSAYEEVAERLFQNACGSFVYVMCIPYIAGGCIF